MQQTWEGESTCHYLLSPLAFLTKSTFLKEKSLCVKLIFIGILLLKTSHIWTGPTVAVCDMITRWMISFCATSMLHVITDKGCEIPESWSWSLCNLSVSQLSSVKQLETLSWQLFISHNSVSISRFIYMNYHFRSQPGSVLGSVAGTISQIETPLLFRFGLLNKLN